VSLYLARYFDGDADAVFRNGITVLGHTPRHPVAIAAKRRGWWCTGLAVAVTAFALLARGL
jgi:hypothetical protein